RQRRARRTHRSPAHVAFLSNLCRRRRSLVAAGQHPGRAAGHRSSHLADQYRIVVALDSLSYDFGYIGLVELLERLEFTFGSLEKLQKFRGHYFNWHDTRTLQPMWPQYVSTVDSGNLAGNLIALKQACLELPDDQLLDAKVIRGLQDTMAGLSQEISQLAAGLQRTDVIT